MGKSITSTNAQLMIAVTGLFPTPQKMEQFTADDIYGVDDVEPVETEMSLDNKLSGGVVPVPVNQSIMLNPSSASCDFFDTWWQNQRSQGDVFTAEGRTTLPAISKKFVHTRGFLVSWTPMPPAGKTLKSRKAIIRWESVVPTAT